MKDSISYISSHVSYNSHQCCSNTFQSHKMMKKKWWSQILNSLKHTHSLWACWTYTNTQKWVLKLVAWDELLYKKWVNNYGWLFVKQLCLQKAFAIINAVSTGYRLNQVGSYKMRLIVSFLIGNKPSFNEFYIAQWIIPLIETSEITLRHKLLTQFDIGACV